MKLGETKLVKLDKLCKLYDINCVVYAKDESTNPSGSIKDRPAYMMVKKFKEEGLLSDGGTIIEATSGNMGISLAFFQKELNYHAIIVMPSSMSLERRKKIQDLGAKLILVDGGMKQCNDKVKELKEQNPGYVLLKQFENPNNPLSHYLGTGPEIVADLEDLDYLFAGMGTGGTISGIGNFFKDNNIKAKVIGVEPFESPLLTSGQAGPHLIQGIGANFVPAILDLNVIDEIVTCKGQDAINMSKQIKVVEGISVGYSAGAALKACFDYIKNNKLENKKMVVVFPDKGDRYSE